MLFTFSDRCNDVVFCLCASQNYFCQITKIKIINTSICFRTIKNVLINQVLKIGIAIGIQQNTI